MARIDLGSCEPFRAWNRLEPRPRHAEFDKVLECSVHDALWMLTRQWQFGEFHGEDTGSAIFAKINMITAPITRFKPSNGAVIPFEDDIPLEEKIEAIPAPFDYKSKLDAAQMFLNIADANFSGLADYDRNNYKNRLIDLFGLAVLEPLNIADNYQTIIEKTKIESNEALNQVRQMAASRYFDGEKVYKALKNNLIATVQNIVNGQAAHISLLSQAASEFLDWFEAAYPILDPNKTAWQPSHLEYQINCSIPNTDGSNLVVNANEYYTGNLDWHSFDVSGLSTDNNLTATATLDETSRIKDVLISAIPVEAKFAGSPNSRWWQFENGRVDLGNFNAQTTDLAKLVFAEYALLYNTDWLIVPHEVPAGSFCDIKGIVVTDVFGQQTFVQSANQGETDDWAGWGMYNLSKSSSEMLRDQPVDTRLLLLPNIVRNQESEPIEEVHMLRDEMTNSVWAVETRIPNQLGSSMDGFNFARAFADALRGVHPPDEIADIVQEVMFKYSLTNTVPDNWIPFLPVHISNTNQRSIKLQRASMPRLFDGAYHHIRPNTPILRFGLDNTNDDLQSLPYFIHEEEVPRAGIQLISTYQRTRWYHGKTVNWYGYRKKIGRGEGSSGLSYDRLEAVKK